MPKYLFGLPLFSVHKIPFLSFAGLVLAVVLSVPLAQFNRFFD
jgi:hypothetical protein